jgi:hypothetical protein
MQYFIQQLQQLFYAQVEVLLSAKHFTTSTICIQSTPYQTCKQVFCLEILSGKPRLML